MKATLLLTVIIIMISTITILLQQSHQIAQAYPCIGGSAKEYCTAYHDGANHAYRDYKTGHDPDIDRHRCMNNSSNDYCNGYARGYSDEADFLG